MEIPDQQLAENLIFVFDFLEGTKKYKSEFGTKFARIIVAINFIKSCISNF